MVNLTTWYFPKNSIKGENHSLLLLDLETIFLYVWICHVSSHKNDKNLKQDDGQNYELNILMLPKLLTPSNPSQKGEKIVKNKKWIMLIPVKLHG